MQHFISEFHDLSLIELLPMLTHKPHFIAACLERCSELQQNSDPPDQTWGHEGLALVSVRGLFSLMMRR